MAASETSRHLELKRLALAWAQAHGYRIAAAEVSAPNFRVRFDVAAFRPHQSRRTNGGALGQAAPPGVTAIFECKQSRADFLRDSRSAERLSARLATLHERRARYEDFLRLRQPSLRNTETLFPEYDTFRYESAGYEPYDRLTKELRQLGNRLQGETKLADLFRWRAANIHYLVTEQDVVKQHEAPLGWGLLVREDGGLKVKVEPTWQEASETARLALLLRIAMAGTRAINQAMGVEIPAFPGAVEGRRPTSPARKKN